MYGYLLVFRSSFEIFNFKNAVTLKTGLGAGLLGLGLGLEAKFAGLGLETSGLGLEALGLGL